MKEKEIDLLAISTSTSSDSALVQEYIDSARSVNPSIVSIVGGLGIKETKLTESENRYDIAGSDLNWAAILETITHRHLS